MKYRFQYYQTPHWSECPYCLEPVGLLGRAMAWLFGTGYHGCTFSNVRWPRHE